MIQSPDWRLMTVADGGLFHLGHCTGSQRDEWCAMNIHEHPWTVSQSLFWRDLPEHLPGNTRKNTNGQWAQARSEESTEMSYGIWEKGSNDNAQIIREALFPQPNVPLWSQFSLRKRNVNNDKWANGNKEDTQRENNTLGRLEKKETCEQNWTDTKRKRTGQFKRRERNRNDTTAKLPDWKATQSENPV